MSVRHSVILLALVINMICYTDRVCIAVAGPEMREAFRLNQAQMGLVYSIFSLSYFLGQAPWGMLADRLGARGIVTFAIAGWSAFTALTAMAWNFVSLLLIRFTFGALEAAFSPSIASAFNRWVPVNERSAAFGAFLAGGRFGGAVTPPLAGLLLLHHGWRSPFFVFGGVGAAASAAWYAWYRHRPEQHPRITPQEAEFIRAGATAAVERAPARTTALLRSKRLWCLLAAAFGSTFMWQFYITWFPTYLREQLRFSVAESSFYAGLPFLLGVGSTWVGGLLTDWIGRRSGTAASRTFVGAISLLGGSALMSAGLWCPDSRLAALLMGLAAGALDLYLGAAWSSATDIGGASGGTAAGLMNAASNCAGFASPALTGWVLQRYGNWTAVLLISVATTCAACVLWFFVNPRPERGQSPVSPF